MNSGVYKITNLVTGKFYIGSSIDLKRRKDKHFSELKHNKHINPHLQSSANKHGIENFNFEILAFCAKEDCVKLEQEFLDILKPDYNICKVAGSCLGRVVTEETILKRRKAMLGRKATQETIEKLRKAHMGHTHTEETKLKMSKSRKGNKHTEEARLKMSKAQLGKKATQETREKMSKAALGRKATQEALINMSKAQKGKIVSKDTREKIGNNHRGKVVSNETKEKQSRAHVGKKLSQEARDKRKEIFAGYEDKGKAKKIINIETNEIYKSIREVSNISGINYSTLAYKLSGRLTNNTPYQYLQNPE